MGRFLWEQYLQLSRGRVSTSSIRPCLMKWTRETQIFKPAMQPPVDRVLFCATIRSQNDYYLWLVGSAAGISASGKKRWPIAVPDYPKKAGSSSGICVGRDTLLADRGEGAVLRHTRAFSFSSKTPWSRASPRLGTVADRPLRGFKRRERMGSALPLVAGTRRASVILGILGAKSPGVYAV